MNVSVVFNDLQRIFCSTLHFLIGTINQSNCNRERTCDNYFQWQVTKDARCAGLDVYVRRVNLS